MSFRTKEQTLQVTDEIHLFTVSRAYCFY